MLLKNKVSQHTHKTFDSRQTCDVWKCYWSHTPELLVKPLLKSLSDLLSRSLSWLGLRTLVVTSCEERGPVGRLVVVTVTAHHTWLLSFSPAAALVCSVCACLMLRECVCVPNATECVCTETQEPCPAGSCAILTVVSHAGETTQITPDYDISWRFTVVPSCTSSTVSDCSVFNDSWD